MSRLGKKEIKIPSGVTVTQDGNSLRFKGPKGELKRDFLTEIVVTVSGDSITLALRGNPTVFGRSLWGTYSSHIRNMIKGVTEGFSEKLLIEGTGYKWSVSGTNLDLSLGFSHPVKLPIPAGLTVKAEKGELVIIGIDKEIVGSFAALVRSLKKPEPYKGKGIRYHDEVIERKQGKRSTA
ncbi:MAG: 50S ribosomal protein L6 [Patescibacteria group bacterium]|mgnify:CR=1 FL=1